jgi:hypothetical protein
MAEPLPLLDYCFQEASCQAADLVGRCVDTVATTLQEAEGLEKSASERARMGRAWWSLLRNRYALKQAYPERLLEAFSGDSLDTQVSTMAELTDSSMVALGEDLSFSEPIEANRLLRNLLPTVEQALAVLDARMSALAGDDAAPFDRNPLRPSVFVHVLRELMHDLEPDTKVRTLWLQHLAAPLGQALGQLYEQIALMLQRAVGQDASYRMRLVADPQSSRADTRGQRDLLDWGPNAFGAVEPVPVGAAAKKAPGSLPAMSDLGRAHAQLDQEVFHAFLGDTQARFDEPLDASYYQQVEQERQRLEAGARIPLLKEVVSQRQRSQFRGLPVVDRPARLVNVGSQLDAERWGAYASSNHRSEVLLELKRKAQRVSQAVGLDLVRKLVNQVARDPLLLAPVREAVVALEPALLRLVLTQPRYLFEDQHPARCLIEQVAERSFRYNDEFAEAFGQFLQPVHRAFLTLNAAAAPTSGDFARALDGLRVDWLRLDTAEQALREQQLRAMRFAETRQTLANRIAMEISKRADLAGVPALVLDFLYNDWSLVIASTQLNHPEEGADPFGYRAVVDRLVWSARPEATLRQPRQLFEIVPDMLRSLHRGLAMLGKSREETQAFFDGLMAIHKPVLKLRRAHARTAVVHSGPTPMDELLDAMPQEAAQEETQRVVAAASGHSIQPPVSEGLWLDERELEGVGFDEGPPSTPADLYGALAFDSAGAPLLDSQGMPLDESLAAAPDPSAPEALSRTEVVAILDSIRQGDWVDLQSKGDWLRAQLMWISGTGSMFMFTSEGGRTHSMTRRSCEKLIRNRMMRPIQVRGVIQTALVAVA